MNKKTKALVFSFVSFVILYIITKYIFNNYTQFTGFKSSLAGFVVSTILSPKFQFVETSDGGKLFMKWLFTNKAREIK